MGTKTLVTNEEFERLAAELGSCELIDGEIVPRAPAGQDHAEFEGNIYLALKLFVRAKKLGRVFVGEAGMHVRKGRSRGADVAFISYKRAPRDKDSRHFLTVAPELVVEVKSEEMSWEKIEDKIKDYHHFGVDIVWVADPETRTVRVFPKNGPVTTIPTNGKIDGGTILQGFRVPISDFFAQD